MPRSTAAKKGTEHFSQSSAEHPKGGVERCSVPVREVVASLAPAGSSDVVTTIQHIPARAARYAPVPGWVRPEVAAAFRACGVVELYTHQAEAAERVHAGSDVVVVTPTASGKTVCYNLPVCNAIADDPDTRALYLFPTKALSADQLAELEALDRALGDRFGVYTYDGDTPADARKAVRQQAHIVLTNPDMLHAGILPHHTKWTRLFENLRYVVIDELHSYRGVFGSHLANVLRRLRRIASFYGSAPQFICASATIANPTEFAGILLGRPVELVDRSGAPQGEKLFVFYNPPVVNRFLGIRRSTIRESARIASELLGRGLQTIVFCNSRLQTEVVLTHLRERDPVRPGASERIRGYRGGYLPGERREIEHGLRGGSIRGVVSTSALELGVDIGSLDASVIAGYPGTVASTWQRAGRAGRRSRASAAIFVAASHPLDQFIVSHPDYFFGEPHEHAFSRPDNLEILINHLKCAAFELPLDAEESFGGLDLRELAAALEERGFLHRSGERWHWTSEAYPADAVSLRAVSSDNFVIVATTDTTEGPRIIGEVDFPSALSMVHPKAIYLHEGEQYHVDRLDFEERKAYCRRVDADYFTTAIRYTEVRVLEEAESEPIDAQRRGNRLDPRRSHRYIVGPARRAHGDVMIRSRVVGFKKIKLFTLENVGSGNLDLPENEMHTTAFWIRLERELVASLPLQMSERQDGMLGLLYALESMAALLLMCDRRDIGTALGEGRELSGAAEASPPTEPEAPPELFEPNLYLYDAYPGGIGLSEPLYRMFDRLLERTRQLVVSCRCESGCPSCVGAPGESGRHAKAAALAILERLIAP